MPAQAGSGASMHLRAGGSPGHCQAGASPLPWPGRTAGASSIRKQIAGGRVKGHRHEQAAAHTLEARAVVEFGATLSPAPCSCVTAKRGEEQRDTGLRIPLWQDRRSHKGEGDGAASLIVIKNRLKETLAFSIVINELFNFRL